jgi:CBS-domain-containing membrane protein
MITWPKTHGPDAGLHDILSFFEDDHVHMALVVAADARLVTAIERPDIPADAPAATLAATLGTLSGRTAHPATALHAATTVLLRQRRRRLAVVDERGCLVGLLCLNKAGTGYCSDDGIRERARDAPAWRRSRLLSQASGPASS